EPLWIAQVLEQLARDDDVEAVVGQLEWLVEVGPARLDPELGRLRERLPVGVHADDLVPVRIRPREGAVAAAEVEHAAPGPAHVAPEQHLPLRPGEDEPGAPFAAVVL